MAHASVNLQHLVDILVIDVMIEQHNGCKAHLVFVAAFDIGRQYIVVFGLIPFCVLELCAEAVAYRPVVYHRNKGLYPLQLFLRSALETCGDHCHKHPLFVILPRAGLKKSLPIAGQYLMGQLVEHRLSDAEAHTSAGDQAVVEGLVLLIGKVGQALP